MTLSELLTFGTASSGITFIIVYGKIFNKIRPTTGWLGKLFSCTLCTGFWVGAFLCGINDYTELFSFEHTVANYLLCGGIGSTFSYAFDAVLGDNGFKIEHTQSGTES
jgi:hypothetical protein